MGEVGKGGPEREGPEGRGPGDAALSAVVDTAAASTPPPTTATTTAAVAAVAAATAAVAATAAGIAVTAAGVGASSSSRPSDRHPLHPTADHGTDARAELLVRGKAHVDVAEQAPLWYWRLRHALRMLLSTGTLS